MIGEVVPFGKYKDQPAETLLADQDYCEWLLAQPWFRERWPNVYNVVINYGAEPQDSPEHNQMQAMYLDDARCFRLANLAWPERVGRCGIQDARALLEANDLYHAVREFCTVQDVPPAIARRRFEDGGWDVVFRADPASVEVSADPARSAGRGQLQWDERQWLQCSHYAQAQYDVVVRVELKPDLGDDYPSVLRQVLNYKAERSDRRCLVARRHAFEHVTWDQVRQIFAASGILLLAESEVDAV